MTKKTKKGLIGKVITQEEVEQMLQKAKETSKNAFIVRGRRHCGACILTTDGNYYTGCNIESLIFGLGTCAERAAVDHAVIHGKYEFKAVLIYSDTKIVPCGACLQYLMQFSQITGADIDVIEADESGKTEQHVLSELLPHGYISTNRIDVLKQYKNK